MLIQKLFVQELDQLSRSIVNAFRSKPVSGKPLVYIRSSVPNALIQ